jgi:hypothetical protein
MNTFILAFSAQQSAISQMLEPNFTAKDAKSAKENGFTAENAEIAEKKWVPDSDQPGYLFLCALSDLCGNFFILCALCALCGGKFRLRRFRRC